MGSNEQYIIAGIVKICQKLDQKGFGANHDGNVTVKYGEKIFATPTGVSKGDVTAESILILDLDGNKISGHEKPFSELNLHLASYKARPDISAVVHAHPPYATARGIVGLPLDKPSIPESVMSLGNTVPVAPFAMPNEAAVADIVSQMLSISHVFMMPGNGVLSVGADLTQAYLRLELVEHLAKIDFIANKLGESKVLSDENINKLLEKRSKAGLATPAQTEAGNTRQDAGNQKTDKELQKIIVEEVVKAIENS